VTGTSEVLDTGALVELAAIVAGRPSSPCFLGVAVGADPAIRQATRPRVAVSQPRSLSHDEAAC
jgi:hypothetical protein